MRPGGRSREAGYTRRWHWVTADLVIGEAPSPEDWPAIVAAGVRAVLEVRSEDGDDPALLQRLGLEYRRVDVDEGEAPPPDELDAVARWAVERMSKGPLLVHCREGRGRSPLVAIAALAHSGFAVSAAYQVVRGARPEMELSDEQVRALKAFALERPRAVQGGKPWN